MVRSGDGLKGGTGGEETGMDVVLTWRVVWNKRTNRRGKRKRYKRKSRIWSFCEA